MLRELQGGNYDIGHMSFSSNRYFYRTLQTRCGFFGRKKRVRSGVEFGDERGKVRTPLLLSALNTTMAASAQGSSFLDLANMNPGQPQRAFAVSQQPQPMGATPGMYAPGHPQQTQQMAAQQRQLLIQRNQQAPQMGIPSHAMNMNVGGMAMAPGQPQPMLAVSTTNQVCFY
jgi:hypothetical protein